MKISIILLIISLSINSISFSATIKGFVVAKDSQKPIHGAAILLNININTFSDSLDIRNNMFGESLNKEVRTYSDKNGFFILNELPTGKGFITVSAIGYMPFSDSIDITDVFWPIDLKIELEAAQIHIDTVTNIENYHRYFTSYKPGDILEIILDSIAVNKSMPTKTKIFSTFINKTDSAIYVVKDIECLRMVELKIKNSEDESFERNSTFIDCVGMKTMIDYSDFITIHPKDSVKYPPVFLYFYNFSRYPIDNYKIKLVYKYQRPDNLPGLKNPNHREKYSKQIYYYNMALRGKFISSNSLSINNSQIVK